MTGVTTGQTNLPTATGSDILRDYVKTALVTALQMIADLFDSASGHDHNGTGKGAPVTKLLAPSVSGTITLSGTASGQNIAANDGHSTLTMQNQISIANNGFGQIVTNSAALAGIAIIVAGDGQSAVVALMGGAHTVVLLAGTPSFTATFGTASKYNVGWNTAQYMIENKIGSTQTFDVIAFA